MYMLGVPRGDIAERTGASLSVVRKDITALRAEWDGERRLRSTLRCAEELARLDNLEAQAWMGWSRSAQVRETRKRETRETTAGRTSVDSVTTEARSGDPRFLKLIYDCIARRTRLLEVELGADAPEADTETLMQKSLRLAAVYARINAEG